MTELKERKDFSDDVFAETKTSSVVVDKIKDDKETKIVESKTKLNSTDTKSNFISDGQTHKISVNTFLHKFSNTIYGLIAILIINIAISYIFAAKQALFKPGLLGLLKNFFVGNDNIMWNVLLSIDIVVLVFCIIFDFKKNVHGNKKKATNNKYINFDDMIKISIRRKNEQ